MRFLRTTVVLLLILLPVLALVAVGIWTLWQSGWLLSLWWLFPVCWAAAYALARNWRAEYVPLPPPGFERPRHWSAQDEQALQLVRQHQQRVQNISPERLTEPQFYLDNALELAGTIARHYHPGADDPVSALTLPEILAAAHLAARDLEAWVRDYLPGSHLLTVRHWRLLAKAPGWFRTVRNVAWGVSALLYPSNIGRFLLSKLTTDSTARQIHANALAWFYAMFVHHVGFYLIEMNSGRLRAGADHYLDIARKLAAQPPTASEAEYDSATQQRPESIASGSSVVTVAVVGQVNAGKSSLVNALLGEQRADIDVLPSTVQVQRYRLELGEPAVQLNLLDTIGYAAEGATPEQLAENCVALEKADLVLLAMNVANPARDADLKLVQSVQTWCAAQRPRKSPRVLGVLTHIDALSPAIEWSPPYDWIQPENRKAQSIRAAVQYNAEMFGELLAGIVPVCSDVQRQRSSGIEEWLLPAMVALLDEARACALVRGLRLDADQARVSRVFHQLKNAGAVLLRAYFQTADK